jgi:hypothetical protein
MGAIAIPLLVGDAGDIVPVNVGSSMNSWWTKITKNERSWGP